MHSYAQLCCLAKHASTVHFGTKFTALLEYNVFGKRIGRMRVRIKISSFPFSRRAYSNLIIVTVAILQFLSCKTKGHVKVSKTLSVTLNYAELSAKRCKNPGTLFSGTIFSSSSCRHFAFSVRGHISISNLSSR
jgi:hypothetical protein